MNGLSKRSFCYLCASRLEPKTNTSWWCPSCKYTQYDGPKVAAEIVLLQGDKVLIAKRGIEPRKGAYDLPGGFVESTENAEQAIYREMEEELGLNAQDVHQLRYLRSFNGTYPYGPEIYRVLVVVFVAELKPGAKVTPADDVAACKWVSKDQLRTIIWALDEHRLNAVEAFKIGGDQE